MKKIDLNCLIKDFDFGNYNRTIQFRLKDPLPLSKKFVTMLDLVMSNRDELLLIKLLGRGTLFHIEDKLEDYGLWLGMTAKEVNDYQGEKIAEEETEEQTTNRGLSQKEWEDRVFRAAMEIELELMRQGVEYQGVWSMEQDAADKAVRLMQEVRFKLCQREE